MRHDLISDVMSAIKNAERVGKRECVVPASNLIRDILKVMQEHDYIGNFEYIEDGRGGKFRIELKGRINDCNSIRPRFPVKKDEFDEWEKKFLPAAGVGILIVTTDEGVVAHTKVKGRKGGALLAYVY